MRTLLCLLVLLCFSLPAFAQDADNTQRLMQFAANNDSFDKNVDAQAKDLFNRQFPGCGKIEQVVRQLPTALGDLKFPAATQLTKFPAPNHGLWIEHVKIRACDKVRQVNLLAAAQTDGTVIMLALLPGDTKADPAIQAEAERIGATTIAKSDATCATPPAIHNTRLLGYRDANGGVVKEDAGSGWVEDWEYRFCQKNASAHVSFVPDADGALTVKARLPEVAKTPVKPATPAKN